MRRRRPRPGLRDEARPAQPARRTSTRRPPTPAGDVADRHGPRLARRSPARPTATRSSFTTDEIAASHLDYLALGHWHSAQQGEAGRVDLRVLRRARAGRARPGPRRQGPAGRARRGARQADRDRRGAGRRADAVRAARARRRDRRRASRRSSRRLASRPTRTSCSTSGWSASGPDELDLDIDEVETRLAPSFLKVRVRDCSMPALTEGALPSPDTIAGAFIRDLEARIAELEAAGQADRGRRAARRAPARAAAARRPRGLAVRIRRLQLHATSAAIASSTSTSRPGLTVVRGPNEAGKTTIQRAIELALTRRVTSAAGDLDALRPWDAAEDARSVIDHRVRAGRGGRRPKTGTLEKTFAGSRRARSGSTYDGQSITDPAAGRPGPRRADRHPDRGVLPLDRVGPPPRARRPRPRRGGAARPAPGVDQRRGPRDQPRRKQEARTGRSTTSRPRATRTRAGSRSPKRGRRPRPQARRAGRAGPRPARARPRRARGRPRAPGRGRGGPGRAPRRCSRRPARPSASTAERAAAQERYERYPPGGRGDTTELARARRDPSVAQPAAGPPCRRRAPARPRRRRSASCGRRWPARSRSQFEVAAEPTLAPAVAAGASRCRSSASSSSARSFAVDLPRRRGPRAPPDGHRRGHRRHRAHPRRGRAVAAPQRPHAAPSCATSRSIDACAVDPRWRRSSRSRRGRPRAASRAAWA